MSVAAGVTMSSGEKKGGRSEDMLGKKMDRCLADSVIKTAGGAAIGVIFSVVLARRRTAPVWLGTGIGLGMGLANCQNDLRNPFLLHGRKVKASDVPKEGEKAADEYVILVSKGESDKQTQ